MGTPELTQLQQIFGVLFAILYGTMLNASMGLRLFHFGWFWEIREIRKRIILSIIVLNLFPAFYFIAILKLLGSIKVMECYQVLAIFLLSVSVFLFYRIVHLVISYRMESFFPSRGYDEKTLKAINPEHNRHEQLGPCRGHWFSIGFYLMLISIALVILSISTGCLFLIFIVKITIILSVLFMFVMRVLNC